MDLIFLPLLRRWNLRLLSLPFAFLLLLFQHFCLSGPVHKGDMAQLSSVFVIFRFWWSVSIISDRDISCMSTCLFFLLQFCKSGSLKTYMYMCIKYMYIRIILFKYLHTKQRIGFLPRITGTTFPRNIWTWEISTPTHFYWN